MPKPTINSGSDVAVSTIATPPEARRLLNRAAIVRDEAERYPGIYDEQELLDVDCSEAAALAYLSPTQSPSPRRAALSFRKTPVRDRQFAVHRR